MILIDELQLQKSVSGLDEKSASIVKAAVPQAFAMAAAPIDAALELQRAQFPWLFDSNPADAVEVDFADHPVSKFMESRNEVVVRKTTEIPVRLDFSKVDLSKVTVSDADKAAVAEFRKKLDAEWADAIAATAE